MGVQRGKEPDRRSAGNLGEEGGGCMKAAIMFTYTRPTAGREAKALEVFTDSMTFFGKLAADGKCGEPMVYLAPSGLGMMIIHGERETLFEITGSDDFAKLYNKATYAVPDVKFELIAAGEGVQEDMQVWGAVGLELGYM
jgi:hypothetical protein